jgi:hypothetical protein
MEEVGLAVIEISSFSRSVDLLESRSNQWEESRRGRKRCKLRHPRLRHARWYPVVAKVSEQRRLGRTQQLVNVAEASGPNLVTGCAAGRPRANARVVRTSPGLRYRRGCGARRSNSWNELRMTRSSIGPSSLLGDSDRK